MSRNVIQSKQDILTGFYPLNLFTFDSTKILKRITAVFSNTRPSRNFPNRQMCFWWMSIICIYDNFLECSRAVWPLLIVTCNANLSGAVDKLIFANLLCPWPRVLKIFVTKLQQFWKCSLRTRSVICKF